jgi:CheY-like chemotaxis protein
MRWKETTGSKINVPRERGYGSTLIEQTLKSHGGEASISYGSDGITCDIRLPLPAEVRSGIDFLNMPKPVRPSMLDIHEPPRGLEGKRILVIEDEPLISMDIEAMLEAEGCEVVGPAMNFETARSMIASAQYDAALLDVNLGGHTVDELAAALTQKNCPFAFVTGYGRAALPQGFREAMVLAKPFSQDRLVATVETLLYRRDGVVPLRQKRD